MRNVPVRAILTGCALALLSGWMAGFGPRGEAACCYFAAQDKDIHQPGQKAFIQWSPDEGIEAFTVQPKFEGNALDFGMVIPTPTQPKLDEMPRDFFKDLAIYTILLPLPSTIDTSLVEQIINMDFTLSEGGGGGGRAEPVRPQKPQTVRILEAGVVGSLDYKIISAERADDLYEWLKANQYSYSGDESTLAFYIKKHWLFTVMKIDPKQMKKTPTGSYTGEVTPTRFTFATRECIYPLKITQISVPDKTDALFYVQAPAQMDLNGDWSWAHSYRPMYLQFMLGCGASEAEQKELQARTQWLTAKKKSDPAYETTKLEWAKRLGDPDFALLDDPVAGYAQGGALPPGGRRVSQSQFLTDVWTAHEAAHPQDAKTKYAVKRLKQMEEDYPDSNGVIMKLDEPKGWLQSPYMWYPNREAPEEDVKGLARLKGHLQKGQWLTKFRKQVRKDEMTDDLVLVPVDAGKEQEYVRIMPTSPP